MKRVSLHFFVEPGFEASFTSGFHLLADTPCRRAETVPDLRKGIVTCTTIKRAAFAALFIVMFDNYSLFAGIIIGNGFVLGGVGLFFWDLT